MVLSTVLCRTRQDLHSFGFILQLTRHLSRRTADLVDCLLPPIWPARAVPSPSRRPEVRDTHVHFLREECAGAG